MMNFIIALIFILMLALIIWGKIDSMRNDREIKMLGTYIWKLNKKIAELEAREYECNFYERYMELQKEKK